MSRKNRLAAVASFLVTVGGIELGFGLAYGFPWQVLGGALVLGLGLGAGGVVAAVWRRW